MCSSGAIYKDECPREHFIPIYLIVGGSTACGLIVFGMLHMICLRLSGDSALGLAVTVVMVIVYVLAGIFTFAWFIAG